jgi:CRISPR-associated protein Csd2
MMSEIKNRYDFVLLFDVKDGNPNGDPDAGNLPRIDPETGNGLVTDVCLKRKVRNYVMLTRPEQPGFDIFVKEKAVLNRAIDAARDEAAAELGVPAEEETEADPKPTKGKGRAKKQDSGQVNAKFAVSDRAQDKLCAKFFDIRTFGAVLSTGDEGGAGQVRGPVQLTFARSVTPIVSLEHSITRMAVTKEEDLAKERTMGRKHTVPYGLYLGYGFVSPALARQTGFSEADLALLWEGLEKMFEHDRSAARGLMSMRKIILFRHASELGSAPSHRLFDLVKVARLGDHPPRQFSDFEVKIEHAGIPAGVEVIELPR